MPVYHDVELRRHVRRRIEDGHLSAATPWHTLAGPGCNYACAVCDEIIPPQELEYKTEKRGGGAQHVHVACFTAWFMESETL